MQVVIGILVAVLVFGIMIFLHELGHFVAALLCKVKVLEFAVGMGPKIFSHTSKKSGIVYSLRALPIGGFTAMQGEDGEDDDPHAFVNRPRWQRLIVLFAGAFMNILTGVIGMFIYLSLTLNVGTNIVAEFHDSNTSSAYGLQVGDEIVRVNDEKMVSHTDIMYQIMLSGTEPVDLTVKRGDETLELQDVVFPTREESGQTFGDIDFFFLGAKPSLGVLLKQTGTQSLATIKVIYKSLAVLLSGKYGMEGVSGPVGTVSVISEAASIGFTPLLYLFVFISLNLGVMNLLPLPALDGGRIIFILIECVRRKPLNPKVEGYIHMAGMVLLLAFMAFVTFFDVSKLF